MSNSNAYTDMFFKPKPVTNLWEQMDKWFNALFWGLLGLPLYILLWNSLMFSIDLVSISDSELKGTYPTMYNNFVTSWVMSTQLGLEWFWPGIYKYYDMFSVQGWLDWFWDFVSLIFFFAPI